MFDDADSRIPLVIDRVDCTKHRAELGQPCWTVWPLTRWARKTPAICGSRAHRAGFNGEIDPRSLQRPSKSTN